MADQSPKVGAGVIIIENGKTLLAQRRGSHGEGMWGSCGGHVEFGEKPSDTAVREAMEELGIELINVKFLCCLDMMVDGKHYIDIGFQATIGKGVPTIQKEEVDKISQVSWFDLDALPEPLFPPIKTYLRSLETGQAYFEIR